MRPCTATDVRASLGRWPVGLLLAALALFAAGCLSFREDGRYACDPETGEDCDPAPDGGGGPLPDGGEPDGGPGGDGGPLATVHGLAGTRHLVTTGEVFRPRDLSRTVLGAYVPQEDGGYTYLPGLGRGDGTFEVPGVPAGPYYLRDGLRYVYTAERTLDLVADEQGRPRPAPNPNPDTTLSFEVSGLAAWESGDELELSAFEAGALVQGMKSWIAPAVGGTSTVSTPVSADTLGLPPLDHTQGDVVSLVQLEQRTVSAGVVYRAASRHLTLHQLSVTPGQNTDVQGSMEALAQTPFTLRWRRSLYAALRPQVHPDATYSDDLVVLNALPETRGYYHGAPTLLQMYLKPATPDETFTLEYGNAFPEAPGRFGRIYTFFIQEFPVTRPSGGSATLPIYFTAYHLDALPGFLAQPLEPQVTPPRQVRINGLDAQVHHTGVGVQPRIEWSPPDVGGSDVLYILHLVRIDVGDVGNPADTQVASFYTPRTELVLPPDLLKPGGQYFFELQALRMPTVDFAKQPYLEGFPKSLAPTLSGVFQP